MEINPTSAVILDLKKKQEAGDASAATTAELLFDTAMLTSGFTIEQPADFAAKIFALMGEAVGDESAADASGGFVPETKKTKEDDDDDAAESVDAEIV